jgi:hypothetical protein
LAQGDNLACFAFQFAQQAAPDLLKGLFSSITQPLSQLTDAVGSAIGNLTTSCPQLQAIDTSQFAQYPGSTGAA